MTRNIQIILGDEDGQNYSCPNCPVLAKILSNNDFGLYGQDLETIIYKLGIGKNILMKILGIDRDLLAKWIRSKKKIPRHYAVILVLMLQIHNYDYIGVGDENF